MTSEELAILKIIGRESVACEHHARKGLILAEGYVFRQVAFSVLCELFFLDIEWHHGVGESEAEFTASLTEKALGILDHIEERVGGEYELTQVGKVLLRLL